jgi:glycosyltransferase involved in cell wall biosynthesis
MTKIQLATYPTAFFRPGGGEIQFMNTVRELKLIDKQISTFSQYSHCKIRRLQLLHLFTVCSSIETYVHAAIRLGAKYVVSPIHWPIYEELASDDRNRIRSILLGAELIFTNSRAESDLLDSFYDLDKANSFRVITNGIATPANDFIGKYKPRRNDSRRTVIFCGHIDKRKNLFSLGKVCEELGWDLTLAGGIRDYKLYAQLKCRYPFIVFAGEYNLFSAQHRRLLQSSDVFCMPSAYETPGLAALEAACFGLPISITSGGSTYEYFGDFADYCNPSSPSSIKDSLLSALSRQQTDLTFIRRVVSEYTWSNAAMSLYRCYKEIL